MNQKVRRNIVTLVLLKVRRNFVTLVLLSVFSVGLTLLVIADARTPSLWKTAFSILGGFLAVSVVVEFLHNATLRRLDDEARLASMSSLFDEKVNDIVKGSVKYGLTGFEERMNFDTLFDKLDKGDELWWIDTYAPGHQQWIDKMKKAANKGAKIKMLALKPGCENAKYRADEIGGRFTPDVFNTELEIFIADMLRAAKEIKPGEGGEITVRTYQDLPSAPIYIVCRNGSPVYGYTGYFLCHATAVNFPHMEWTAGQDHMLFHFAEYFKAKWKKWE